ncbi:Glucanosyltransferase-domain-containing protein [Exophiala viscosa]|uniref:1,3-beta-glucanosyltransferase n=1 Tax=Exophiala viscosa TaxID=2486360 RepID=A0AAN6IFH3_9EURO|nr:Glucanosyltransferase-domain-containing protein [Exophiala viscosa]KAI1630354.1 Glucanosyltransferase-domain-containing protein [Exophiala viscosa]
MAVVALIVSTFCAVANAIPTISTVGSKFFTSDGNQFFIKGVAYQLVEDDPLANPTQCQLDAALMKTLGANSIRVYHVDASADHSGCMNAFADNGIYVWVDMDSFKTYIQLAGVPSWTTNKSDSYRAVMDNFQQYDNLAGLFVGNEVLNTDADSGAAPYLLSAATDLKSYRDAKGYRQIPIGYSATDTAVLRPMLQDYLVCRPNATERMDFYALNSYEWCGSSATYDTSGYVNLQADAENYPIPIFFSEDGCNTVPPRTFNDQAAIFGPDMVNTWSGAIIYEWIQETNDYGLVSYGAQGTPTPVQPDFSNLASQWATLTPTGVQSAAYSSTFSASIPTCPSSTAGGWTADPSAALPTIGAAGVSSGMPSGVPTGSITSVGSITVMSSTSQTSSTYSSTVTSSGSSAHTTSASSTSSSSSSGAASSATHKAAAGRVVPNSPGSEVMGLMGTVTALIAVGAGVVFWL